jgi:hypothetical protein
MAVPSEIAIVPCGKGVAIPASLGTTRVPI